MRAGRRRTRRRTSSSTGASRRSAASCTRIRRSATAWAQAGREIPCFGTTHADHFHGAVPVTRDLTAEEIGGDYEARTGDVIVETIEGLGLDPLEMPAVLVRSHGPFAWGSDEAEAVENAIALEAVASMALSSLALAPELPPIAPDLLERHFRRKHGAGGLLRPAAMIALRLHDVGDVRLHDEPVPEPAPGEVLLRVAAVGLCGSDLHWFAEGGIGDAVLERPLVLGHEPVAVVEERAARGRARRGRPGDPVRALRPVPRRRRAPLPRLPVRRTRLRPTARCGS